jgi:peptide/nickel transport system permease protein
MTSETALIETNPGPLSRAAPISWRHRLRRSKWGLRIGLAIVGGYVILAVFAPLIAPYGPNEQNISIALQGPSWHHLVGTDSLGRDEFSRLVFATRFDLLLAVSATGLALFIGTAIGVLAGFFRGYVDTLLSRITDMLMAIPLYPLLVLMLFVLGSGMVSVIVVLAVTDWVGYARLARSQVLVVREQNFIAAARLGGLRSARVMFRHLLPNISSQLLVLWSSDIVMAIGTIAALGYLGIGIQLPTAEWGVMVQDGQDYLLTDWLLSFAPGMAIVVLGIGLALISDGIAGKGRAL